MAKTYHHGDLKTAAIRKTVEIIQKKGDVDFTLREIAQSLKVSHTAVYRHFQSKQDLLSHIAEQGFAALTDSFIEQIARARTSRQKLLASGRAYIDFALKNPGHYRSMFHRDLRCEEAQRPELDEVQNQTFRKLDPLVAARNIWSSVHGFSILLLDGQFESVRSKSEIETAIEEHLSWIERALLR